MQHLLSKGDGVYNALRIRSRCRAGAGGGGILGGLLASGFGKASKLANPIYPALKLGTNRISTQLALFCVVSMI